jgi:streptogramin lyase
MKTMRGLSIALLSLCIAVSAMASPESCSKDSSCVRLDGVVSSGAGSSAIAIAGAAVTIYQAHESSPQVLAIVTSDANGKFKIELPVDGNDGIRYAVARKGKSVELAAIIGTTTPSAITINEMTTIATGYAMAQLFRNGEIVGKSLPLQVAAGMAQNLVLVTTGAASAIIMSSPNADETNAFRALGTLSNILAGCVRNESIGCASLFSLTTAAQGPKSITTLEAVLAIAHNPTTNVKQLFSLGDAVKVYEPYLLPQQGPESPDELQRLDGFTLAIKVNATGRVRANGDEECPFGGPGNIAFDKNGYAWITNNVIQGTPNSAHCFVVLKPNGQPADGSGDTPNSPIFGGGIVGQGFGIGIDPSGNVWAGNFGWGDEIPNGSVSQFTPSGIAISPSRTGYVDGLSRVQGTISDQKGNIWMASLGNDSLRVFPNGDPHAALHYADANTHPFHVQIDDDGFGWVTYTATSALSRFALSNTGLLLQFSVPLGNNSEPKGMGLDSHGNAWVAAGAPSLVYAVDKKGKLIGAFSGGGILGPWGLALDSNDNVWVANFGPPDQLTTKYRLSRLCGVRVNNCPSGFRVGDPISPDTGYTLPSAGAPVLLKNGEPLYAPFPVLSYKPLMRATATHIDMAGNVWITNNWKPSGVNDVAANPGGDGIVIFVGLAAPVEPTFTGQPKAP